MKQKFSMAADERIQQAWTALSARFFFVLLAVLAALGALLWSQTGRWTVALPEMLGAAVGVASAILGVTAGKAWSGRDEAVSQRRCVSLHVAFFLMNWTAYGAIFVMYFVDWQGRLWQLLALTVVAAVYFTRRILAAKCGLILYSTAEQRRQGDRWFLWASVGLSVVLMGVGAAILVVRGLAGWLPVAVLIGMGAAVGMIFWGYYRWLIRMSARAAEAQVAQAEEEADEE